MLTNTIKYIMVFKKESNREGLRKKAFREYIFLLIGIMIISGVLLILWGYSIPEQSLYSFWKIPCTSIGSSLLGIGIVSIAFKAASVSLMKEEIMKDVVVTTLKETEHTYIPKMMGMRAYVSVKIVPSENNNRIPKMQIYEEKTLKNLHELTMDRRKVKTVLYEGQTCELKNIEVKIGSRSKKFNPDTNQKHSQLISLEYLFNWDSVPGDDNEKLIKFLRDKFNIDLDENAEINRPDDTTIRISNDDNSAKIIMDEKEEKAIIEINGGKTHELKLKMENSKRNIYFLDSQKNMEIYEYFIPYIPPLNKGEVVSTKAKYEWSPCKATPNTSNYDEFAYTLDFPTNELVIKIIAEDPFYFTNLDRRVIDSSEKEIKVMSGPVVTKDYIINEDDERKRRIKEAEWNLPIGDLTHLNTYEIRFWLGIM